MSGQIGKPKIAITMGDPCGVGPEVIAAALSDPRIREMCIPIVIGDPRALRRAGDRVRVELKIREIFSPEKALENEENEINLYCPMSLEESDIRPGKPTDRTARATIAYIERAVKLTMQKRTDALCTGPINKAVLLRAGFSFPGHTEYLQHLTEASRVVMMLVGPSLRVSLVTIHVPLKDVPSLIKMEEVVETIKITGNALREFFGIERPRIAVCGLNPHAGEEGKFGHEEVEVIGEAIKKTRDLLPFQVSGPHPADTVFFHASRGAYDAVVAMYHDQGLIPIKLLHFHEAVNVTLGLPIIRTSVDHGTAYDIAGKGVAHPGSMKAAISLAVQMVNHRNRRGATGRA